MTSMPASRNARAMTLAPRSWPSRPGLATSTRIGVVIFLQFSHFLVGSKHLAERIADLPEGRVRPHRVQEARHRVLRPLGGALQCSQRAVHVRLTAAAAQRGELLFLMPG